MKQCPKFSIPETPGPHPRVKSACKIITLDRARTGCLVDHGTWVTILNNLKSENEHLLQIMEKTMIVKSEW